MSLPAGWRQLIAPDGRVYYQNDITRTTSWNPPTPQQQITPLQTINNTTQNDNEPIRRKIWDKEHLIWLFFFCTLFYDLFADVQVAIAWTNLQSLCPQFKCHTLMDFFIPINVLSVAMLTISIIGFIGDLILKAQDAKLRLV